MRAWIESVVGVVELTMNGLEDEQGPIYLGAETDGLGLADTKADFASGVAPGGRLTGVSVREQKGVLHLVVQHTSVDDRRELLQLVADAIRYRDSSPLPLLVLEQSDGTQYERAFVSEGASGEMSTAAGAHAVNVLASVIFPHPYWRARVPEQIVQEPSSDWSLLPQFDLQRVVDASTAAERLVTNRGSVPVPISWQIFGPAAAGSRVLINGSGFELATPLGAGEVLSVQVSQQGVAVVDGAGQNVFRKLATNAEFPWLPDRSSRLELLLVAPVPGASRIVGTYLPEVEVVH